jgi:hypothetical protein
MLFYAATRRGTTELSAGADKMQVHGEQSAAAVISVPDDRLREAAVPLGRRFLAAEPPTHSPVPM